MIEFTLPFPPTVNQLYATYNGRRIKSRKYLSWIKEAIINTNEQGVPPVIERCIIVYEMSAPDKRRRDAGNYEKAMTDLLVTQEILIDDCKEHLKGIFAYWNDKSGKEIPGREIRVKIYLVDEFPMPDLMH